MKKRILLAALLLVSLLTVGFARQSSPRTVWEYRVEFYGNISQKKLNELGAEGWELTGVANERDINEFIFKRAK